MSQGRGFKSWHHCWPLCLKVQGSRPGTTYGTCGFYYKPITIVNDDYKVVNKLKTSLTDDATVIVCDRHMFEAQATDEVCSGFIELLDFLFNKIFGENSYCQMKSGFPEAVFLVVCDPFLNELWAA